jgi:hypothetical protein
LGKIIHRSTRLFLKINWSAKMSLAKTKILLFPGVFWHDSMLRKSAQIHSENGRPDSPDIFSLSPAPSLPSNSPFLI